MVNWKQGMAVLAMAGSVAFSAPAASEEYTTRDLNEQLVMATLWMQQSAEFRALSYQAFNIARISLDNYLARHDGGKPVAIIVDADETVIDNSAYEAFLVDQDFGYSSKTWEPWMAAGEATEMPGAGAFLAYAASRGVETFYVTNRKAVGYDGTAKNLKALGYPNVDEKHLLVRTGSSDKQERRDIVNKDYDVALLMGDNLNDFESVFGGASIAERFAATDARQALWGTQYIVVPNPTYGEWEGAAYQYNWGASAAEKSKMRKDLLRRWDYTPPAN